MAKAKLRERHVVVISREWDNPAIQISVTDVRIAIAMKLDAFVQAMAKEIKTIDQPLGEIELLQALTRASDTVCQKMKNETSKVM